MVFAGRRLEPRDCLSMEELSMASIANKPMRAMRCSPCTARCGGKGVAKVKLSERVVPESLDGQAVLSVQRFGTGCGKPIPNVVKTSSVASAIDIGKAFVLCVAVIVCRYMTGH